MHAIHEYDKSTLYIKNQDHIDTTDSLNHYAYLLLRNIN